MFEIAYATAGLLEAPLPQDDGSVLFTNVTAGGVYRYADGVATELVPGRRGIGGLATHTDGGLLVSGRDLSYAGSDGLLELLAPVGATGINDLTVAADGSVIVGVLRHRPQRGEAAVPSELLRIDSAGAVSELATDLLWPNGIGYSPDGTTLYVAEYAASRIRAVRDGETHVFAHAPRGECDGLTVDSVGGVWVALGSGAGIARFAPDGHLDQLIDVDTAFVSSLAFAGSTLYVTTAGALLAANMDVSGPARPAASIPLPAPSEREPS